MTFDRQFYEYSGECSYVLAKDLIDGLFTVVVNYDTARHEKSLTVKVDGHTIEVAPGYKVKRCPSCRTEWHWLPWMALMGLLAWYPTILVESLRLVWKSDTHTCQGYPGYFREPHWNSMGLPEISRVTLTGMDTELPKSIVMITRVTCPVT